ncbi:asparagine synthase-related protein [Orrella marina]|uniref:asparagine synthase (glutamine-hydrolyzing) n=1 Tax=Orrella marina TaxID=2163011 RepID=A0A2R4XG05_9BURK|nr:asparagine synthase C-terminal domain-containing protein [Orrella marina]AWB32742.1 asparagine synthase [Orrella marina]
MIDQPLDIPVSNAHCTTLKWRAGIVFIEGIIQRVQGDTGQKALENLISMLDASGPAALADVQGDFVALVRSEGAIHAFKSFTSQFQLFYRPKDRLVSNRLYPLWDSDSEWNPAYFARHCFIVPGYQFMSAESPIAGVNRVLPGELVTFTRSGIEHQTYVQRQYRYKLDTTQTREQEAPGILALLRDAIATRLQARPDADICVEISGGLDSSFVACLLGEQRKNVNACPEGTRAIRGVMFSQPDIPSHAISERYAREVADRYGIDLIIVAPDALPWDSVHVQHYSDEPSDFFWYGDLFSRAVAELADPGSYVFTGFGADQLFLRSPAFLPYLLGRGEFAAWYKTLPHVSKLLARGQINLTWQCLLSQMPASWHRTLCNSRLFARSSLWDVSDVNMDRMLTNEVPWLKSRQSLAALTEQRRQQEAQLVGVDGIICDDWGYFSAPRTVCQSHFDHKGLVDASPFCDLALMDHMYNHVSAHLVHDFESPYKSLLREAQKGIVPETLRHRKSDTFVFNSFQLRYIEQSRERFEALIESANADWIDIAGAHQALEQVTFGMATSSTRSVVALLGYLQWQETFRQKAPRLKSQPEATCHMAQI